MANPHPDFSPACPIPYVVQAPERVAQLEAYLKTEFGQLQRINIEPLIQLYKDGKLEPRQQGEAPLYLVEGQIVDKDPWEDPSIPKTATKWCEVSHLFYRSHIGYYLGILAHTNNIFRACFISR
jgi:hypothetical protein